MSSHVRVVRRHLTVALRRGVEIVRFAVPVAALSVCAAFAPVYGEERPAPAPAPVIEPAEELPTLVLTEQLLKEIETKPADAIWDPVNRLVRLGRTDAGVALALEKRLKSEDPKVQLACARALCQLNNNENAAPTLARLVQHETSSEIRRLAANAIGLTTTLYNEEPINQALAAALAKETDDATKISLARSLWRVASNNEGRDALMKLLVQSRDKSIKDEAALVLAENGFMKVHEVRVHLLNLYTEPTSQGERAFNLLRRAEEESTRGPDPKLVQGEQLIREVLRAVRDAYPDETKWNLDKLFEDAAKGMVGGLDPFSQYMDRDEVKATQEMLQQDYGGIGAYVGLRNNAFVITSPIYGAPADRAGLRALDILYEVDGVKTGDMIDKGGINAVIGKLKGKPGSTVKLKYFRRGYARPVEISLVREQIRVETVFSTMLPGNVGYLRLTRFGERSAEEMQAALDNLVKEQKARALVFDMRDNPGGLLRAGVEIADKFLQGNKLVVYSEGNKDFAPRKDYFSAGGPEDEALPMVVLVGSGSASAAEIVAGALQDHKRALLIGEKTYGKGSVQQIMPLRATDRQTQLRLTVAKYYLPSGRCIHEKGIDVDIEVKPEEIHSWVVETLLDLRRTGVFEDFIRDSWDAHKDTYAKLALFDEKKWENWPSFEGFYQKLNTRLDRDQIRAELRMSVRRRYQDEKKKELVVDIEEDEVLQRGVLAVMKKMDVDPGLFAEYRGLAEKFAKKANANAQEGAMVPEAKDNP